MKTRRFKKSQYLMEKIKEREKKKVQSLVSRRLIREFQSYLEKS